MLELPSSSPTAMPDKQGGMSAVARRAKAGNDRGSDNSEANTVDQALRA